MGFWSVYSARSCWCGGASERAGGRRTGKRRDGAWRPLHDHDRGLNTGATPTGEILAHLNVASIEGTVYVDPEDWSPSRSQQLSLEPGESQKLSWELQAVNAGHFAAYVVVVPFGAR